MEKMKIEKKVSINKKNYLLYYISEKIEYKQ